jgi:hypothetical protein
MTLTADPVEVLGETVWIRMPTVEPASFAVESSGGPLQLGGSIRGRRVGLRTEGSWTSWLTIVDEWTTLLEQDGAIPVVLTANGSRIGADAAGTQARIDAWAASIDLGISGLGTCGSCTAYTVLDGVSIDKAGKPAAVAITEEFVPHARSIAAHVGHPDVGILVFPHPLEGRPEDELREIGRQYYPRFLAMVGATR